MLSSFILDVLDTPAAFSAWLMIKGMAIGFAIPFGIAWVQVREYEKKITSEYERLMLEKKR